MVKVQEWWCDKLLPALQAPPALALTEVITVLVLYFIYSVPLHGRARGVHYSFRRSLEDVVLLSLLRGVAVILAYLFGSGRKYQMCVLLLSLFAAVVLFSQLPRQLPCFPHTDLRQTSSTHIHMHNAPPAGFLQLPH